jgi:hypothetical protein
MKTTLLIPIILLNVLIGCQRSEPEPELPDYETALNFVCRDNLSEYYGKAVLRGQRLCYSTNDAFYKNFAYGVTSTVTSTDSIHFNPTEGDSKIRAMFGVGGLGDVWTPPSPVFFSVVTPEYSGKGREYFQKKIFPGAELDIISTEETKQTQEAIRKIFTIELFGQYDVSWGKNVTNFQTWSGPQDPATAYLKVLEIQEKPDGSIDLTLGFRCKLYDNGRFYTEVTDGEIRTNVKF